MRKYLLGTRFFARVCALAFLLFYTVGTTQADALSSGMGMAGVLRPVGNYPYNLHGHIVAGLTDGKVLAYGTNDIGVGGNKEKRWSRLRDFNARAGEAMHGENYSMWNPQKRGWRKVEPPPECRYHRYLHTMTALPNGKVLIVGGLCDAPRMRNDNTPYPPQTQLSLWNGATEAWESAPSLAAARIFHTASLLSDGSVLIVGGEGDPALSQSTGEPVLNSVERYHDGRLERLGSLRLARARHTATAQADGSVLVVGGFDKDGKAIAAAELWDAARQAWRDVAPLKTPRHSHSATLLSDGRVMIAGGVGADGETIGSVEVWNPQRNTWSVGQPLLLPLKEHNATRLANGNVLVVGSSVVDTTPMLSVFLWGRLTERWWPAGSRMPLSGEAWLPQALTLIPYPDGTAHLFSNNSILHWMPGKGAPVSHPIYGQRLRHTTTLTTDGRILLAGGQAGGWSSNASVDWAEVFDPASGHFALTGRMRQPRSQHSALTLADGRVVVADGIVSHPDKPQQHAANSPEVWDPRTGAWSLISDIRFEAEDRVHMGQLQDGSVLFFNVRVSRDGETYRPMEYRAWTWKPAEGRVEQMQVKASPRLRAAIAVLPDGRVLIAGGQTVSYVPEVRCPPVSRPTTPADEEEEGDGCRDESAGWMENANATAELWDSRSGSVVALDAPPGQPMQNPRTLVLKSGQVVVTDLVPANPYYLDRPPFPVLLWNPASQKWLQLPAVPAHQGWPMTALKDGTLATRSQRLLPGAASWTAVSAIQDEAAEVVEWSTGRLLAMTAEPPHLSVYDSLAKRWQLSPVRDEMPRWRSKPVLLPLADGRLMAVGQAEAGPGGVDTAHIWNPRDNSWASAGSLVRRYGWPKQAVQLASGRVLHIGTYSGSHVCELWEPSGNTWTHCETLTITAPAPTRSGGQTRHFVLSTLDNGKAALVVNKDEALVFRETGGDWVRAKLEWNDEALPYGAPIRPKQAFARLFDEESQAWVDASALAAEFLQRNSSPPPVFLWDRKKHEWAYNFIPGIRRMGLNAVFLPDGCALSTQRSSLPVNERVWTVFNPSTGEVTKHIDPGSGISQGGEVAVLIDGTVVVVDATYGIPGGMGFFHRKMSCAGFEKQADDAYLIPPENFQTDLTPPRVQARPPELPWAARLKDQVWEYRWVLLALLGPLVMYGLLKWRILPWGRRLLVRLMRRDGAVRPGRGGATVGSTSFRLSLRVILYGTALVVGLPMLVNIVFFHRIKLADEYATNPSAFLDEKTGVLKPIPSLASTSSDATEAKIPCRYVGVWSSIQAGSIHRITLKDDGRYVMAPSEYSSDRSGGYTGYWAVQGNSMIWRHEQKSTGEPDINPILPDSDTRFTLIEENGRRTRYELIEAVRSTTCTP